MKKCPTILIVGGAGYIGSHITALLESCGYQTVVLDNLSRGGRAVVKGRKFIVGEMGDTGLLKRLFVDFTFDAVILLAAFTDIAESQQKPSLYYQNNVIDTLKLFDLMARFNLKHILFSSSAAVYGMPKAMVIDEDHPCNPINPYGRTKLIIEMALRDFVSAYGFKGIALRYFNVAGWNPSGEIPYFFRRENNLIPKIFDSLKKGVAIPLYGVDYPTKDGSCVRDYIDVSDLAKAHRLALEKLLRCDAPEFTAYNLGNRRGYTVFEVISAVENVTGKKVDVVYESRRLGDPPILIASSAKAERELGWRPDCTDLREIVSSYYVARGAL